MSDDLAAEIAAHRPQTDDRCWVCKECADSVHPQVCSECGEPWPCLVARLGQERAVLLEVLARLDGHPTPADMRGRCWFCGGGLGHGPDGHESDCPWAAMRMLVPADQEGTR